MIKYIDEFLNRITMYKLVLYSLVFLWCIAFSLAFFDKLPFQATDLLLSLLFMMGISLGVNHVVAWAFKVPSNIDSVYITVLILALIISPAKSLNDYIFLLAASVMAMVSKYLLAINKKHLFNPAALAVVATGFIMGRYASWWIGNSLLVVWVLIAGLLITRKIQRFDLVVSFIAVSLAVTAGFVLYKGQSLEFVLEQALIDSPLLFFAFVMLTEPATTPPTRWLRVGYGALVGVLFVPFVKIAGFNFSPELALVAGNIFVYVVSPKQKLVLALHAKNQITESVCDFIFTSTEKMKFKPGQYMEWTLGHPKQDLRGIRRYFTIASSPTEEDILIGVKFYAKPSSYKRALDTLKTGDTIVASQLAGDFTLPNDKNKKLVFMAGGIGVTPFRSMVKYLIDTKEKRDITVLYAIKNEGEAAYKDVFDQAEHELGIKTIYALSDAESAPTDPRFKAEKVSEAMIRQEVPDFKDRMFYISGPKSMIDAFESMLKKMGVPRTHIKTDFFPGFV